MRPRPSMCFASDKTGTLTLNELAVAAFNR